MRVVAVVILHYKNAQDTLECIQSIEKSDLPKDVRLSIVVVDNASPNPFKTTNKRVFVIRNNENLGYSGGNNTGISYALANGADFVLILNNDTFVHQRMIEELLRGASEFPQAGVFSPKIYFAKGSEYHISRYKKSELGKVIWYAGGKIDWQNVSGRHYGVDEVDQRQFDEQKEISFVTGCCLFVPRNIFEKVGLFDEKYFLYYEDADFSMRIKKYGLDMLYIPKAMLWHKNASSAGIGSNLQDYYISRNKILFGIKYGSFRVKFALIREGIKLLSSGRRWQKQGVIDYYLGRFGKGSFAL